jgi:hypothetical protein
MLILKNSKWTLILKKEYNKFQLRANQNIFLMIEKFLV